MFALPSISGNQYIILLFSVHIARNEIFKSADTLSAKAFLLNAPVPRIFITSKGKN